VRRAFALIILIAAPLVAQSIRVGPARKFPLATGSGGASDMIALLDHGADVVAFRSDSALHATILDPAGSRLGDIAVDPVAGSSAMAATADGYLRIEFQEWGWLPALPGGRTSMSWLDRDLHRRSGPIELPSSTEALAVACGGVRCAAVLFTQSKLSTECYLTTLEVDGSMHGHVSLPLGTSASIAVTANGFIAAYHDANDIFHTQFIDVNGAPGRVNDFGVLPSPLSGGSVTVAGDGAIAIWPEGDTLRAASLTADGALVATNFIARFDSAEIGHVAVSCKSTECAAAAEWRGHIRAVRFTTSLVAFDAKPVAITDTGRNLHPCVIATEAGSMIGWNGDEMARYAVLGQGANPYAGDPSARGLPINDGPVSVSGVAAVRGAVAWIDVSRDGHRTIRATHIDDEGQPIEPEPLKIAEDDSAFAGASNVAVGVVNGTYVVAWQTAPNVTAYATLDGTTRGSTAGELSAIVTDGRRSVLVTSEALIPFGVSLPTPLAPPLPYGRAGVLTSRGLFLAGGSSAVFLDLQSGATTSTRLPFGYDLAGVAIHDDTLLLVISNVTNSLVQRFTIDGKPIDAQPRAIAAPGVQAVAALGPFFAIAGSDAIRLLDAANGWISSPFQLSRSRHVVLVPIDDTHVLSVSIVPEYLGWGPDVTLIETRSIELTTDVHHRAARR